MFDWLEFDNRTKEEQEQQIAHLEKILSEYAELNRNIRNMPIYDKPDEACLKKLADAPIPARGRDYMEVYRELIDSVYSKSMMIQHPRFFSFVASAVSPYSLAGSFLSDMYNLHAGAWEEAPGAAMIEEKLVSWMGSLAGYPEKTRGGIFVSGGSMANMTAMAAARDAKLDPMDFGKGTVYMSDQAHSSNAKGLRIIGFRNDQIVIIPSDDDFRIRLDLLEEAVQKDQAAGRIPFAVIGNLGSTNTGSIDPLEEMGLIAKKYNLWFHIDGAYGGSVLLSPVYRNLAKGIELSDSFSWDQHKWLMQVYSCSAVLVRDRQRLLNSFTEHPEYLADVSSGDHCDGWNMGPEMSRPHRALKLWYTIQASGTDMLAEMVEYTIDHAKSVRQMLMCLDNWEILSQPSCATINFRYHPQGMTEEELDRLNHGISKAIIQSGYAYIVTTVLHGKTSLRMCMINANSTQEDIEETVKLLDRLAKEQEAAVRG